jgi:rfaE bifunctional protein nucleotidyltransferase chain/domain
LDSSTAKERIVDRDDLAAALRKHHPGQTVVFTNGCFDILHPGHVRALEDARALGDIIVVGVNSDASVQRLKGEGRPIVPQRERAEVIAALRSVDYVTIFEEDTPVETIQALRPEVHVKGGDYDPDTLPEAAAVRAYGGRVVCVPFVEGQSTTDIVARILERSR